MRLRACPTAPPNAAWPAPQVPWSDLLYALCTLALQAPSCAAAELASWAGYYRLRGLPLESPAALLLDAVLTLHAAVVRVQQQLLLAARHGEQATAHADLPAAAAAMAGGRAGQAAAAALPQPLVLHLLGPRRELDAWPLLLELGCLLPPGQRIELHLVGPEVPPWAHGRGLRVGPPAAPPCGRQGCSCGRQAAAPGSESVEQQAARVGSAGSEHAGGPAGWQTLFFWRGAWHEVAAEVEAKHGAPHAVVAPNAGKLRAWEMSALFTGRAAGRRTAPARLAAQCRLGVIPERHSTAVSPSIVVPPSLAAAPSPILSLPCPAPPCRPGRFHGMDSDGAAALGGHAAKPLDCSSCRSGGSSSRP